MIHFREAAESDLHILKDIAKRVISEIFAAFLGAKATSAFIESGGMDREIENGMGNCTVAIRDGQIIGFAVVKDDLLHLMMIDLPFQKAGNGSALLKYIEDALFARYDCLRLQTFRDNRAAVLFYEKNGWTQVGQEPFGDSDIIVMQYEKQKKPENDKSDRNHTAIGISLGLCFGAAFGFLFDNLALGVGVGLCLGIAIGGSIRKK